jgi:thiamine phosphate synthase YjbQ (UPF0047 family)
VLAPDKPYRSYQHNRLEDNAHKHLKRTIRGRKVVLAVTGGWVRVPWSRFFMVNSAVREEKGSGKNNRRVIIYRKYLIK